MFVSRDEDFKEFPGNIWQFRRVSFHLLWVGIRSILLPEAPAIAILTILGVD
jgi:hypothetical protein